MVSSPNHQSCMYTWHTTFWSREREEILLLPLTTLVLDLAYIWSINISSTSSRRRPRELARLHKYVRKDKLEKGPCDWNTKTDCMQLDTHTPPRPASSRHDKSSPPSKPQNTSIFVTLFFFFFLLSMHIYAMHIHHINISISLSLSTCMYVRWSCSSIYLGADFNPSSGCALVCLFLSSSMQIVI